MNTTTEAPQTKRLFFGLEVKAPWPEEHPPGRMLDETHRHMTLAFLGDVPHEPLFKALATIPTPINIGHVGLFKECLLLPPRHPNVVAYGVQWLENIDPLLAYIQSLNTWLVEHDYHPANPERAWLPHVTLCRQPFNAKEWLKAFKPLPFITTSIHLYESVGNLHYEPRWSEPLLPPFEELEHTADIAFNIHGKDLSQIFIHAQIALAFKFPVFLNYLSSATPNSLDDIVILLNSMVTAVDKNEGSPLKAVSFHGELMNIHPNLLTWEMIVDV